MWLTIWAFFALFILGFVGWTLLILWQQKKNWKAFAKKHKLSYDPGSFMGSPSIQGAFNDRNIYVYAEALQTPDARSQRYVNVIEIHLGGGMPTGGVVATQELKNFVNSLVFDGTFAPDLPEWSGDYLLKVRDTKPAKAYLTKERQQVLHKLFATKKITAMFFFDEIEAVLRIQTPLPMSKPGQLEKIVKKLSAAATILQPTAEEKKTFQKHVLKAKKKALADEEASLDEHDEYDESDEPQETETPRKKDTPDKPVHKTDTNKKSGNTKSTAKKS